MRIEAKGHITSVYGKSESSRIYDPKNKKQVFQWLLKETCDLKGNKIQYFYKSENGENLTGASCENNRNHTAGKYIQSIK